jgi:hypothetical protein
MDEHLYDDLIERAFEKVAIGGVEGIIDTEKCIYVKSEMKYHVDLITTVSATVTTVKQGIS